MVRPPPLAPLPPKKYFNCDENKNKKKMSENKTLTFYAYFDFFNKIGNFDQSG